MKHRARHQQGMAVIAALLVVGAAAVIASTMLRGQSERARLVQSERSRAQARWLLLGGVEWGRQILRETARHSPITSMDQPWALPIVDLRLDPPGESEPALLSGRIEDEQGKFNLQNLAVQGQVDPRQLVAFERLLQALNLRPSVAPVIARRIAAGQPQAARDAVDNGATAAAGSGVTAPRNTNTGNTDAGNTSTGAGNAATGNTAKAVRPPLAPGVQSLEDLRGIAGIDDEALQRLRCCATVLPEQSPINVNTAPPEVIYAVVAPLPLGQAVAMAAERDRGRYFNDAADFANRLANPAIRLDKDGIATDSLWFSLSGVVRLGHATAAMQALLERDEQSTRLVWMREMN
ncbi:type II secretion system minor pseudopilin GspK [Bordetella bronchialis]|uniref:type II secretion system minor pseudopilin GspK n=1 Tax=Bordetella bronchialis TaxID=463025 RepID=UPI003CFF9276